jgi:hypothetical protein
LIPRIAAVGTSFSPLPCLDWHGYGVAIAHRVEIEVGADGHASPPPSGAAAAAPPAGAPPSHTVRPASRSPPLLSTWHHLVWDPFASRTCWSVPNCQTKNVSAHAAAHAISPILSQPTAVSVLTPKYQSNTRPIARTLPSPFARLTGIHVLSVGLRTIPWPHSQVFVMPRAIS